MQLGLRLNTGKKKMCMFLVHGWRALVPFKHCLCVCAVCLTCCKDGGGYVIRFGTASAVHFGKGVRGKKSQHTHTKKKPTKNPLTFQWIFQLCIISTDGKVHLFKADSVYLTFSRPHWSKGWEQRMEGNNFSKNALKLGWNGI